MQNVSKILFALAFACGVVAFGNANDSLNYRIKACAHKQEYNAKYDNCEIEYVPEFVMKNGDLAFQKNYQSCYAMQTMQNLQGKLHTLWIYNPTPKKARIYPTMKPILAFDDTNADFFILHIDNDKKPRISPKCAYFTYKNKQGKDISQLLGAKVSETHKKFLYFIDVVDNNEIANLQNYTISIIFETEGQGFFKADWFFGYWSGNVK